MDLKEFDFRIYSKTQDKYLDELINKTTDIGINVSNRKKKTVYVCSAEEGLDEYTKCEIELFSGYLDKKHKKVYENDIIQCGKNKYYVLFVRGEFGLSDRYGLCGIHLLQTEEFEIIGNIHENKDLLNDI